MKQLYTFLLVSIFMFTGSVSYAYVTQKDWDESSVINTHERIQAVDAHECEKYPDRCPDYKKEVEIQATEIDDCKWYPERCKKEEQAQQVQIQLDAHECEKYPDRCPDYHKKETRSDVGGNVSPGQGNNTIQWARTHNSTRSNRTEWIFVSDNEIEDCKWDPPKCRDQIAAQIQEQRIQLRTDNSLWCWGRAARHCSQEMRQERREILKERLHIQQREYNWLHRQLQPRVERLFEGLSEEERDRLFERFTTLMEQHQESNNTRLLAAILILQEALEDVDHIVAPDM